MNLLKKVHQGKWLLSATRSKSDPAVVNTKVKSIDGNILEFRVITIRPDTARGDDREERKRVVDEADTP